MNARPKSDRPYSEQKHGPPPRVWTAERALMAAVLEDSLHIMDGSTSAKALERVQTVEWFASDDTRWPYSFVNVCAELGLNPSAVRARVAHTTRAYSYRRRFLC